MRRVFSRLCVVVCCLLLLPVAIAGCCCVCSLLDVGRCRCWLSVVGCWLIAVCCLLLAEVSHSCMVCVVDGCWSALVVARWLLFVVACCVM